MANLKTERLQSRYIPKGANCILEHTNGSALYTYDTAGKFYAIAFWGTAKNNLFHYCYRTEAQRQDKVLAFKASVESSLAAKQARKAEKSAWVNPLKVGDILYTSWGYDQTNTEFFVITHVSGKRVKVAEIASSYDETGYMSGNTKAIKPVRIIGTETTHVAQPSGPHGAYVKISSSRHARLDSGGTHRVSSYA